MGWGQKSEASFVFLLIMRSEHRWIEPFVCTPREQRKRPTHAERMRACRGRMQATKKHWESALRVHARHSKYPEWHLTVPRGARKATVGDYCVYVEVTVKDEPQKWPMGKVVGCVGEVLIVQRLNFAGVTFRAQKYAAVLSSKAWKVSRWYHC